MTTAKYTRKQSVRRTSRIGEDFWNRIGAVDSIAHALSKTPGGIEGALARLNAAKAAGIEPSLEIALGAHRCAQQDQTARQIHAFLRSVRPWPDCIPNDEYDAGRDVISLIADSVPGDDPGAQPDIELTLAQMADVLYFLLMMYPHDPANWWKEPEDEPNHLIGMCDVLRCLEANLRRLANPAGGDRARLRKAALAALETEPAQS